jgi:hypothetical protein
MTIAGIAAAERLFNQLEARKAECIAALLGDREFVLATFPHHEAAARRETAWLGRAQSHLLEQVASDVR